MHIDMYMRKQNQVMFVQMLPLQLEKVTEPY